MDRHKGSVGLVVLVVAGGLVGLVLLGALGTALNLVTIPWLKFNKQIETNRDIIGKTYSAENALYNYHWFKERHEAIKATENKTKIAREQIAAFETSAGVRSEWTFEDKTEHARLNAVSHGLRSQYEDLVAEYNARAKEVDRAIFQNELPLFFTINQF